MNDGECKVGMRVAWNAKARRTKGIAVGTLGRSLSHLAGTVIEMDKNEFGSDLARVRWDDGEIGLVCTDWIKRAWAVGGYRPSKHALRKE